jgi:hypothetical protein
MFSQLGFFCVILRFWKKFCAFGKNQNQEQKIKIKSKKKKQKRATI